MLSEIKERDIVSVPVEGNSPEDEAASRELPTHRYIYTNTKAKAIIHAHPPHAVGLSITENKIVPQDAEAQYLIKGAPIIRVRDAIGSTEAGKYLVGNGYQNGYVVAMVKGHGSFAIGATLEEAYKYTSCLENACKILFVVKTVEGVREKPAGVIDRGASHNVMRRDERRTAIPPGIGVMDRSRRNRR
jgi:L-fuculose-phosphate aldolase